MAFVGLINLMAAYREVLVAVILIAAIGGVLYTLAWHENWVPFIIICVILGLIVLSIAGYFLSKLYKEIKSSHEFKLKMDQEIKEAEERRKIIEAENAKLEEERRIKEKYHHYEILAQGLSSIYTSYKNCAPIDRDYKSQLQFANHLTNSLGEVPIPEGKEIAKYLDAEMKYLKQYKNVDPLKDGYPNFKKRLLEYGLATNVQLNYNSTTSNNHFAGNVDYDCIDKSSFEKNPARARNVLYCQSNSIKDSLLAYDHTAIVGVLDKYTVYLMEFAKKLDNKANGRSLKGQQIDDTFSSIYNDIDFLIHYHYTFIRPLLYDFASKMDFLWHVCHNMPEDRLYSMKYTREAYFPVDDKLLAMGINP